MNPLSRLRRLYWIVEKCSIPVVAPPDGYRFKPHERPMLPGSPATPEHPPSRRAAYLGIGVLLALTGGFQNGIVLAGLPQIQGALGLTPVEGGWIVAIYTMANACMSILLFKCRQQFGLQRFTRAAMVALVAVTLLQLLASGFRAELAIRAVSGVVGSAMSSLAIFYIMQGMPRAVRLAGLMIGVGLAQLALPLARVIAPLLIDQGSVHTVFVFEFALAVLCRALVALLPIPPGETFDAFHKLDLVSFALLATAIALLSAVLTQGRIQWWDHSWMAAGVGVALLLLAAAVWIESGRQAPLLQVAWMSTGDMVRFAMTGALVRILLGEQTVGGAGLLGALGMSPDQLIGFNLVVVGASLAGLVISIVTLNPKDLTRSLLIALALLAAGGILEIHSGVQTRPPQLYLGQALIAFAALSFMGPIMLEGLIRALAKGFDHIISFSATFALSNTLGGLIGSAVLGSFVTWRTQVHLRGLTDQLTLGDPVVANAIARGAQALRPVQGDAALDQASSVATIVRGLGQEAAVAAFNDLFLLIGAMATVAFVIVGARWLNYRRRGIVPLSRELGALQALMGGKANDG